jgi:hypothetical protein
MLAHAAWVLPRIEPVYATHRSGGGLDGVRRQPGRQENVLERPILKKFPCWSKRRPDSGALSMVPSDGTIAAVYRARRLASLRSAFERS